MNTFNLTLDLNKSRAANPVRIRQGDAQGTTITALILDHGATADLTGYTAQFVMDLPDGAHYYRKAASISGNTVTVTIDETQAASVTGRTTLAYFQLLQGSTVKASTGCVTVEVLPDALDGKSVPESYDSAIQDAIDALDAAVADMPDMVEDVLADHPEWTTTVQDGSITKDKLATDLALDRERLLYRLDNLLTNALPEGETATATDAARTPMAALALYGRSTQDGTPTPSAPVAIQSVGPQLWNPMSYSAATSNGITWTPTSDGIRASGSLTAASSYMASNPTATTDARLVHLTAGTYTISNQDGTSMQALLYDSAMSRTVVADWVTTRSVTFTVTGERWLFVNLRYITQGVAIDTTFRIALYTGSTAYPYVPYGHAGLWARRTSNASAYTVTPVSLDGHELRSLPDGTRDELTVDERGHAVLVQRVGVYTVTASSEYTDGSAIGSTHHRINFTLTQSDRSNAKVQSLCTHLPWAFDTSATNHFFISSDANISAIVAAANAVNARAALVGAEFAYSLMNPVTHDLGIVDPVPLVGPDLTAQAVPSATFALTYERDLNATLARLESAIATLA